ncbi:hypothetical protein J4772_06340 [Cohnella sp. LGH]|uniref:exodeoxyribonuclease X C-terminal domain-containing protein n=1 Tax=Cohnella sp. LGH TaxID=1619153 RepID=UPI001ADAEA6A|nr:hypothetical protein [Cohnella sp. LGH]QTH44020.1 hypothetical protein J4772_06340 [Cohnella sp. LGH]
MEMTFGKYKGKEVEEVFRMNPGYFNWMKENGLSRKEDYQYFIEVVPEQFPESFAWDIDIHSGYRCWSCKREMDIFLMFNPELENAFREGYPIISALSHFKPTSLIPFVQQYGIKLQNRFSKTIGGKCVMHICPHCNMHQGDYHVVEDNHQITDVRQTLTISYDKSKNCWHEV